MLTASRTLCQLAPSKDTLRTQNLSLTWCRNLPRLESLISTESPRKSLLTRIENGVGGLPEVFNLATAMTEVESDPLN